MEPSRGECQALRPRPEREVCNPQIHLLHLPHHLSRLEARKTDNDNAKQQKRKIEDNSNCSQPLACAQASHPFVQTGGGKAGSPLTQMEQSLSSIKQAPFFHCTIARLAAAHTFLMAEISRHALTDLSVPSLGKLQCCTGPNTIDIIGLFFLSQHTPAASLSNTTFRLGCPSLLKYMYVAA